jgi:Protein of unknown function (DUF3293)
MASGPERWPVRGGVRRVFPQTGWGLEHASRQLPIRLAPGETAADVARVTPGLRKAYLQTAYVVRAPQGVHALRIGARHAAFDAELEAAGAQCWAVITAWNPGSRLRSADENAAAQRALLQTLSEQTLVAWAAEGKADGGGWREESACVLDVEPAAAVALGRKFGQLAVVVGQRKGAAQLLAVTVA